MTLWNSVRAWSSRLSHTSPILMLGITAILGLARAGCQGGAFQAARGIDWPRLLGSGRHLGRSRARIWVLQDSGRRNGLDETGFRAWTTI